MAGQAGRDVEDGLRKVYTDVASLQLLPDAPQHAQFLSMLQQGIQKYLTTTAAQKQQQSAQQAQQLAGAGGAPSAGAGGGAPLPPAPGPAQFGPGGASGGGSPGPVQMPNPDELRRVLAGSSGVAG